MGCLNSYDKGLRLENANLNDKLKIVQKRLSSLTTNYDLSQQTIGKLQEENKKLRIQFDYLKEECETNTRDVSDEIAGDLYFAEVRSQD